MLPFLVNCLKNSRRPLILGAPGIGKSDCVLEAARICNADLVLMHPAISDPTDYKGMPAITNNGTEAHFLPFGDLNKLVKAKKKTLCFLDDIGQAPPACQSALMQLILARSVNGTKISDEVVFFGASNNINQMSGVSGLIEPLKSRFHTILTLTPNLQDFSDWWWARGYDERVIAFLNYKTDLLAKFTPTKEIKNSPCPRQWAAIGDWLKDGIEDLEILEGAVGKGAATEFLSFIRVYKDLPPIKDILEKPKTTKVPSEPSALYAVVVGLTRAATDKNLENIITYLERFDNGKEFEVLCLKEIERTNTKALECTAFVKWASKNKSVVI